LVIPYNVCLYQYTDINECADLKKIQCYKDRSRCVNYLGGYVCFCHQGWTGKHCENGNYN
jgi:hypothetical protein